MSVEGIYVSPISGKRTPREKLDDVCLEICQLKPFAGTDPETGKPDKQDRLVNATSRDEREQLLEKAEKTGIGVDGLVGLIRRKDGHYRRVLSALGELEKKRGLK